MLAVEVIGRDYCNPRGMGMGCDDDEDGPDAVPSPEMRAFAGMTLRDGMDYIRAAIESARRVRAVKVPRRRAARVLVQLLNETKTPPFPGA